MSRNVKAVYVEPENYFPKEIRKKYGLGEFAPDEDDRDKRFIWDEGDVELYDKDGNRIDPKTGKAIVDENDPYAPELKQLLLAEQMSNRGKQND